MTVRFPVRYLQLTLLRTSSVPGALSSVDVTSDKFGSRCVILDLFPSLSSVGFIGQVRFPVRYLQLMLLRTSSVPGALSSVDVTSDKFGSRSVPGALSSVDVTSDKFGSRCVIFSWGFIGQVRFPVRYLQVGFHRTSSVPGALSSVDVTSDKFGSRSVPGALSSVDVTSDKFSSRCVIFSWGYLIQVNLVPILSRDGRLATVATGGNKLARLGQITCSYSTALGTVQRYRCVVCSATQRSERSSAIVVSFVLQHSARSGQRYQCVVCSAAQCSERSSVTVVSFALQHSARSGPVLPLCRLFCNTALGAVQRYRCVVCPATQRSERSTLSMCRLIYSTVLGAVQCYRCVVCSATQRSGRSSATVVSFVLQHSARSGPVLPLCRLFCNTALRAVQCYRCVVCSANTQRSERCRVLTPTSCADGAAQGSQAEAEATNKYRSETCPRDNPSLPVRLSVCLHHANICKPLFLVPRSRDCQECPLRQKPRFLGTVSEVALVTVVIGSGTLLERIAETFLTWLTSTLACIAVHRRISSQMDKHYCSPSCEPGTFIL
ncbi:hypothetical protein J6590_047026 [Homalodisca vitripennis]|nr:hypothetical protein J6590_047026 [Homalodisca vitripennis]